MAQSLNRHQRTLELDKVLALVASETTSPDSRDRVLSLTPSTDRAQVCRELQKVSDAYALLCRFGTPRLGGIHAVNGALRRAQAGAVLTMAELLQIAGVLRAVRMVKDWHRQCEGIHTSLDEYFQMLMPNKNFEEKITTNILSEEEMADTASEALSAIRRKIRSAELRIRDRLDALIHSSAYQRYLQDAIVTIRDDRFVVPVKAEFRGEVKGIVHDTSSSGATVFIEPISVVEANNDIRLLRGKEQDEIEKILAEMSEEAGELCEVILADYELLIDLDVYFAKANYGAATKAVVPAVSDGFAVNLKKARHPLIEQSRVVPIDIRIGEDFSVLVVTGPNTGGKTVALKTIGLLSLMAMCGLMIPAGDNSTIAVFSQILVDIGDEQSIEQSLSTFSSHMTNIIGILKAADDSSLVLIDELGAGTDPVEGAALAVSIIESLKEKGAKVAATTHYAEIKMYAIDTDGVENACCEFDVNTLRPTYKLLIGVPGRSNAFAISERLGVEHAIVERARQLVSGENTRFEEIVTSLENTRQELESKTREVEQLRSQAQREREETAALLKKTAQEKDREIDKAKQEAKRMVERVKAESQQLIDELTEIRRQKESEAFAELTAKAKSQLKSRLGRLSDLADPVRQAADDGYRLPRPLKSGDTVVLKDIGKNGIVISPPDKTGMVQVQAGIMKTSVPLSNLRLVEKKAAKPASSRGGVVKNIRSKSEMSIQDEISVRGLTVEEALIEVDRFLDNAVLAGLNVVRIIHGKGSGALKNAVQQELRHNKRVRSFRLGVYGEGESGVTIVELK